MGIYGSKQFKITTMMMDALILQRTLGELMEQVVLLSQLVDASRKEIYIVVIRKELKECLRAVLKCITMHMIPSAYFKGIIRLLGHTDGKVKRKVHPVIRPFVYDLYTMSLIGFASVTRLGDYH